MPKLSVVLAVRNEETNLGICLKSVKEIADEIVVVDEYSKDKTVEIAKRYGAKVYEEPHHAIFHITKQKAIDRATGDWILQLDADEVVPTSLAKEIREIVEMTSQEIRSRKIIDNGKWKLFQRHQKLIEERDGSVGNETGEIAAFFIPRVNYFLNRPLIHAGVYPDASIRLIKKGKARFTGKSVHDIMQIDGEVNWLFNDLEHHDSPTLKKYFIRLNRYTDLHAEELKVKKIPKNPLFLIHYLLFLPLFIFLKLYIRHKGFLDGVRGFLWSFFSSLHYPIAYFKYLTKKYKKDYTEV